MKRAAQIGLLALVTAQLGTLVFARIYFGDKSGETILVFPMNQQVLLPSMVRTNRVGAYLEGQLTRDATLACQWSCSPGWSISQGVFSPNGVQQTGWIQADFANGAHRVTVTVTNVDSDADGMPDAWELLYGLDPHNPNDAAQDADNDGLTNLAEFRKGTDPLNGDTDADMIPDEIDKSPAPILPTISFKLIYPRSGGEL